VVYSTLIIKYSISHIFNIYFISISRFVRNFIPTSETESTYVQQREVWAFVLYTLYTLPVAYISNL